MKHIITIAIALPFLVVAASACDSPDDEAELAALEVDEDETPQELKAQEDAQGSPAPGLQQEVTNASQQPEAALPNQLCRTNDTAKLYSSPTTWTWVPSYGLVRILDYRGEFHYLARYDGKVGQLERSKVIQESCYNQ